MEDILFDDLQPFSDEILICFREWLTPENCASRLRQRGFPLDEATDLTQGSRLIEAIKKVLIEKLYEDDEVREVRKTKNGFFLEALRRQQNNETQEKLSKWYFLAIIESLDNRASKKQTKELVKSFNQRLAPLMTWFPNSVLTKWEKNYGIKIG